MKQRVLAGESVSAIGFGAMYISIRERPDEAQALAALHAAFDAGITFVDTADVYCLDDADLGHSERLVAKALEGRTERILVGTKGGLRRPRGAWTRDARPERLVEACHASLRALGVSTIDLYQLHAPDPRVPLADSVGALARLRAEGKVRHVGLSNVSVAEIEEARAIVPIVSVQNRYSPGHREPETDGVLDYCTRQGITFLPYSPFGGANGARFLGRGTALGAEAERRGLSPHQLVLVWMLAKSPAILPLVGARRAETIVDSARAADLALSEAEIAALEGMFGDAAP